MAPVRAIDTTQPVPWRPTSLMKACDLAKDDDFLSHILVERLSTGAVLLVVHKMDPSYRPPPIDPDSILPLVRRLTAESLTVPQAVDEFLALPSIRRYVDEYTPQQINAFATHASRYFELYHLSGWIEIARTSRYTHRTGKPELCILATRALCPGTVIKALKGSLAPLSDDDDIYSTPSGSNVRNDFSIIRSEQMKKDYLLLGPARFVNHDCNNNCELSREGKQITFRVSRSIAVGEEITAHYGDDYFGRGNRHCLCSSCEKAGRGGYTPYTNDVLSMDLESDPNSDDWEVKEQEILAPIRTPQRSPSMPLSLAGLLLPEVPQMPARHVRRSARRTHAPMPIDMDLRSSRSPPARLLIDCILIVRSSRFLTAQPEEVPAAHSRTTDIPWARWETYFSQ
ncbi:hypothetical protein B0H14DRAFT_524317 [Mycena olivaceomarginata]|nr:hypothetical protein B0H14DRAFT_524317 [Mycena olivaceomarginata]